MTHLTFGIFDHFFDHFDDDRRDIARQYADRLTLAEALGRPLQHGPARRVAWRLGCRDWRGPIPNLDVMVPLLGQGSVQPKMLENIDR
jgi:hypothetical protein